MGASNSHEYEPANTTPVKPEQSRILTIDPRSPSADITRTPIIVGKTPEGMLDPRSPSADIARTPLGFVPAGGPIDPRSPTVGILRTPLSSITQLQTAETASNLTEETVPKLDLDMDMTEPVDPLTEDVDPIEGQVLLDPLSISNIQDLSLDCLPTCESTRLVAKEVDQENKSSGETTKPKKKKKTKPSQQKDLYPNTKKPVATGLKDMTRSPLATRNIDMNSPLKLVQRKQMKDIDMKRTCSLESSRSHFIVKDKENM